MNVAKAASLWSTCRLERDSACLKRKKTLRRAGGGKQVKRRSSASVSPCRPVEHGGGEQPFGGTDFGPGWAGGITATLLLHVIKSKARELTGRPYTGRSMIVGRGRTPWRK